MRIQQSQAKIKLGYSRVKAKIKLGYSRVKAKIKLGYSRDKYEERGYRWINM